jgi:predicted MFS family arabinose efflux permease
VRPNAALKEKRATSMKTKFWVGAVLVVLGLASLFISVPRKEERKISAGDLSIGVQLQRRDRVPPVIGIVLIAVGGALILTGIPRR